MTDVASKKKTFKQAAQSRGLEMLQGAIKPRKRKINVQSRQSAAKRRRINRRVPQRKPKRQNKRNPKKNSKLNKDIFS